MTAKDSGAEFEDTMTMIDKTQYEELLNEYSELAAAMKETRQELSKLQDLVRHDVLLAPGACIVKEVTASYTGSGDLVDRFVRFEVLVAPHHTR